MNKILCIIAAALGFSVGAGSQNIQPVVMNSDHSVTISVKFPDAEEVSIKGSFLPRARTFRTPAGVFGKDGEEEMTKREDGVWTFTTKPLSPELYTYSFEVDDKDTFDISCPARYRDITTWLNYFIIPGGIANDYMTNKVPHGKVSLVWYDSKIPGLPRRRMAVYTPPNYTKGRRYPVLYLLHGTGGDERSWTELGRAQNILDNLIAAKRCVPMIVVMPNGIANRAATPGEDPFNTAPASATAVESMLGIIEGAFMPEVVKYIETHYPVIAAKSGRAIAGLSLGGLHTLFISANNPKAFDYVGLFSAQTTNTITSSRKIGRIERLASTIDKISDTFPFLARGGKGKRIDGYASLVGEGRLAVYDSLDYKLRQQFDDKPKLYYIAYGRDDFVKKLNEDFRQRLDSNNYKYVLNITDGGHSWENWRKYLVDFLPRLFK